MTIISSVYLFTGWRRMRMILAWGMSALSACAIIMRGSSSPLLSGICCHPSKSVRYVGDPSTKINNDMRSKIIFNLGNNVLSRSL